MNWQRLIYDFYVRTTFSILPRPHHNSLHYRLIIIHVYKINKVSIRDFVVAATPQINFVAAHALKIPHHHYETGAKWLTVMVIIDAQLIISWNTTIP